ncbi:beta-N-acetylhexosaminidase [Hwanghaeella grinnelliae]|uniref:beta-N-acetylhexosaminidase n=1 Tax=Hwanghaeella grinnelliae TaxID=2500179 RepID=A0A3S2ZB14_9PROT|nr:beta-N-acetylhexosaminidase [Hwanghaeella grinnelliae]RVU39618.1 beta-N-acetylhexosaminidase [Hwanghaeella grinnelliae]
MPASNVIYGLEETMPTAQERAFFRDMDPFGYILFARNIKDAEQVRALTKSLREISGRDDLPILIDQEGGRVQRLRGPHFREAPPAGAIAELALIDEKQGLRAAYLHALGIGVQLRDLGITVDCAPCLDLRFEGASDVIGDRSYGNDPELVGKLGRAAIDGFRQAGVMPVIKHLPGHGRALVDSHHGLPVIDTGLELLAKTDFRPFANCRQKTWGMTAHLVLTAVDPDRPITQSATGIQEIIRDRIGFDGPLMTDDLSMNALTGEMAYRADKAVAAGCDLLLHCNGKFDEMESVAEAVVPLSGKALERIKGAPIPKQAAHPGLTEIEAELSDLLARTQ